MLTETQFLGQSLFLNCDPLALLILSGKCWQALVGSNINGESGAKASGL